MESSYILQQHEVTERKTRSLMGIINAIFSNLGLNKGFVGKALLTTCYSQSRMHAKKDKFCKVGVINEITVSCKSQTKWSNRKERIGL